MLVLPQTLDFDVSPEAQRVVLEVLSGSAHPPACPCDGEQMAPAAVSSGSGNMRSGVVEMTAKVL